VLWPIVGIHHYPKPEEWPIMPVHRIGLRLEPDGFFTRNPSLDLPPSSPGHCAPGAGHGHSGHDHSAHDHH
jgi:primary-amine oxidase